MSEDEKKPAPQPLEKGYQPTETKGFVPTKPETMAKDGFTPTASKNPATPPQTVRNTATSVTPAPKPDKQAE